MVCARGQSGSGKKLRERLEWQYRNGRYEKRLEALAEQGRAAAITALASKPELRIDLIPAWHAFIELHNRRQFGMNPNPLAYGDIVRWLDENRFFDLEARDILRESVIFLDNTWLGLYFDDPKNKSKKDKAPMRGGKTR